MKLRQALFCLLAGLWLLACSLTPSTSDTATRVAADVFATLTAAAPTATLPPSPTPTPATPTVRVAVDSSGDYANLHDAVAGLPAGATILLDAGTYVLDRPLEIRQSLRLLGAGMDRTFIVSEAPEYVVHFSGSGPFIAQGITFHHRGEAGASVVVVHDGEVSFEDCRFTGAHFASGEDRAGLWLLGNSTGTVRECTADSGQGDGIRVSDGSDATIEDSTFTGYGVGFSFRGNATGTARRNRCNNNAVGIWIGDSARPVLEDNTANYNSLIGIAYMDTSGGSAENNECAFNSLIGIAVVATANPLLGNNNCHDNTEGDIADLR